KGVFSLKGVFSSKDVFGLVCAVRMDGIRSTIAATVTPNAAIELRSRARMSYLPLPRPDRSTTSAIILNEDATAVQPIDERVQSFAWPLIPDRIRLLGPWIPKHLMAALASILHLATDLQQRRGILRLDSTQRFEAKRLQGSCKSVKAPAVLPD